MSIEVVRHERLVMKRMLMALLTIGATTAALRVAAADGVALYNAVRVAFYESAPESIAASMRAALGEACSATHRPGPDRAWLCAGKSLRFFRGVDVLGHQQKTGFACDVENVTPDLRYYTEDMLAENPGCEFLSFDAKANKHHLAKP